MTHIDINENLLPLIGRKEQVLDGITGFVEHYDFSRANSSYEARVQAVTKVASICYGNPKSLGSINLFNRLEAESHGLPSSSYEFVPVLISIPYLDMKIFCDWNSPKLVSKRGFKIETADMNIFKYGEKVENGKYLLTNFRAIAYDFENLGIDLRDIFNTEEQCEIMKKHFKVFLFNVDLPTRAQMVRHRVSWQELSRRYVSGKKTPFEFYISEKLRRVSIVTGWSESGSYTKETDFDDYIDIGLRLYNAALDSGVKSEEARRILPQAMMTTIWGAFLPSQLDNWFQLRLHKTAQREIQQTAQAMKELM